MKRSSSDIAFLLATLAVILGLGAILGTCAPVWPATCPSPYCPGGTAVRVYDGGTGAHDAATARRNLGISTGNIVGWTDSLSSLFYKAIQDPLLRVKDSQFWIKNVSDTTKKAQFSAASIPTGTTRTYTFPALSGTFMLVGDLLTPGIAHYDGLFRIKDGDLVLKNSADTTKKAVLTVGSATGTTRTLTLPDTTGTLSALNKTQTFTRAQTISLAADNTGLTIIAPSGAVENAFNVYSVDAGSSVAHIDPGGGNFGTAFCLQDFGTTGAAIIIPKAATTLVKTYKIDNAITTNSEFLMNNGTQTSNGNKTFGGADVFNGGTQVRCDGTNTRFTFTDFNTTTKQMAFQLGGITAATTRSDTIPDVDGTLVIRRNARDFTGITANIAATNLATTPTAGVYRVSVYGVTTALLGAGVVVTLGWTDAKQAQTSNVFTLGTAAGSESSLDLPIQVASGSITITTTGYVTGTYSLYCRVEAL